MRSVRDLSERKKAQSKERQAGRGGKGKSLRSGESSQDAQIEPEEPFVSTAVYSDDELVNDKDEDAVIVAVESESAVVVGESAEPPKKMKPKKNIGDDSRRRKTGGLVSLLVFVDAAGGRAEIELDHRPATYSELQRDIARIKANRIDNRIFVIQNERGDKIFPENYIPSSKFVVREMFTVREFPHRLLQSLGTRFETSEYHDFAFKTAMARVEDL